LSLAHKDDEFETPPWVQDIIFNETCLVFDLDLCATKENTVCKRFYSKEDSGLNLLATDGPIFCNPPRSLNGKFVNRIYDLWHTFNIPSVMLLCWNDLGNKYGEKLIPHIINGEIEVHNLGKVKFYKNGKESEYPSRLTYFWAWFKKR